MSRFQTATEFPEMSARRAPCLVDERQLAEFKREFLVADMTHSTQPLEARDALHNVDCVCGICDLRWQKLAKASEAASVPPRQSMAKLPDRILRKIARRPPMRLQTNLSGRSPTTPFLMPDRGD